MNSETIEKLIQQNATKIVLLVISGGGGVQSGPNMLTELQQAHIPNIDALMRRSAAGLLYPIAPGITPSSRAATLALLGFDHSAKTVILDKKYKLKACGIFQQKSDKALFASLGMDVFEENAEVGTLFSKFVDVYDQYDFFFISIQETEILGQQGEYYRKIKVIEKVDRYLPGLVEKSPDVIAVTADHSTPTAMAATSWHPVPVLLHSKFCRYDDVMHFDEISCAQGSLGVMRSVDLMPLLLANASRLRPFSA